MARLLFLDIDGVLLPYSQMRSENRICHEILPGANGCPRFDPGCVANLNWICASGKASIVISSSWRQHISCEETMRLVLKLQGIEATMVGMTPIAEGEWESHDRGDEIAFFMKSLQVNVDSFVILDDCDMGWAGLEGRWVQPDGNIGLQRCDAEHALAILNNGDDAKDITKAR